MKTRLRPHPAPQVNAWTNSSELPLVAVGVAAVTASGRAALVDPLRHMGAIPTIVYSEQNLDLLVPGWSRVTTPVDLPTSVRAVLADGHYLALGHHLWLASRARGLPYLVAQHGLITPLAPPLPAGSTVLAWTERDGTYWSSGRTDVHHEVVGSQLLWSAASDRSPSRPATRLVYLGQGHAAELSRSRLAHAAITACRAHGATYRPHPSERDLASRAVLSAYTRAGVAVDASGIELVDLEASFVSVFSTGVLEAAARGHDAWVEFPRPPAWLGEFWERYGMRRLGDNPTPSPQQPGVEPARRIASILTEAAS